MGLWQFNKVSEVFESKQLALMLSITELLLTLAYTELYHSQLGIPKVSNRVWFCIYRIYIYFLRFYLIWEFKLIKCVDWNYPYTQIANVQCFLFLFPSGYISSLDVFSMWNSEMLVFVKNVVAKYYCYNFSRCTWGFQWRSCHFRGDSMRGIFF